MSIQSTNFRRSIAYTSSLLPCIVPLGISSLQLFFFTFFFVYYLALPFADAQSESDTNDVDGSLSPSLGIIVIVLLSFFLTGLLSVYIRWCADSPSNRGTVLPIIVSRDERRGYSHGLDKSVIERFPTFLYSAVKELKIGQGCLECAVCLNEFEDHEKLRLLPKCNHVFHPDCIGAWLVSHTTCPVCRTNLVPSSHETELVTGIELNHDSDSDESVPEAEVQQNHVQITVGEGRNIATEIAKQRKRGNGRFTRSYSAGHSLIRLGLDCERFTLRLPDEVRKQLMNGSKLKRAASFVALRRISSSRRGYRSSDDGGNNGRSSRLLGHSDRWALPMTLPLVTQTASVKVGTVGVDGDVTAATGCKRFSTAAVTPLDG